MKQCIRELVPTSLSQGVLSLLVVCSQVGNGMQGCRGDGVVRPLPDQAGQPLHCIVAQHLGLHQGSGEKPRSRSLVGGKRHG